MNTENICHPSHTFPGMDLLTLIDSKSIKRQLLSRSLKLSRRSSTHLMSILLQGHSQYQFSENQIVPSGQKSSVSECGFYNAQLSSAFIFQVERNHQNLLLFPFNEHKNTVVQLFLTPHHLLHPLVISQYTVQQQQQQKNFENSKML